MLIVSLIATPPTAIGWWTATRIFSATSSAASKILDPVEQDDELVAAEAGDEVIGPAGAPDPVRDLLQHLVATGMTVRVVDRLEVVEIAEQHGDAAPESRTAGEHLGDALLELAPVGQPGQGIVLRAMGKRRDVLVVRHGGLPAVLCRHLSIAR